MDGIDRSEGGAALHQEASRLQDRLDDLVALSGLRASWVGHEPTAMLESFSEALLGVLRADLVLVRWHPTPGTRADILRAATGALPEERARQIVEKLDSMVVEDSAGSPCSVPGLLETGPLALSVVPLDHRREHSVLVVGSTRPGFPDDFERALMNIGVSQLSVALRERQLFDHHQTDFAQRESEERFRSALAHASVGAAVTTFEGRFLQVNPALCEITGYTESELLATDSMSITHAEDLSLQLASIGRMRAGEIPGFVLEKRYLTKVGGVVWVQNSYALVRDPEGQPTGLVVLVQDITNRKRVEDALGASEGLFRAVFDSALDAMLIADDAGRNVEVNPAACLLLGRRREELLQMTIDEISAEDMDFAAAWQAFRRAGRHEGEWRVVRGDGAVRDVESMSTASVMPGLHLGVLRDVTERKAVELDLSRKTEEVTAARERLGSLSRRLVILQEEERRRIARELHDEVGQILTGMKLMLETSGRPGAAVDLAQLTDVAAQLLERVKDLSLNLRPPMLDDLGLVPTLVWHFERYRSQTGVEVEFHHRGVGARMAAGTEITAFRIIQEALTNVARHAEVREATVELWREGSRLKLRVWDRGRGFDPDQTGSPSSGLTGMRERAELAGGALTLETRPGGGTRLEAELPLDGDEWATPLSEGRP